MNPRIRTFIQVGDSCKSFDCGKDDLNKGIQNNLYVSKVL